MNAGYKISAKIIMSRLNNVREIVTEKEQTCAGKGHLMRENLCYPREMIHNRTDFYILGLDPQKAFDYLWAVLRA